jgi:predicted metalloprotease with PDZ domain
MEYKITIPSPQQQYIHFEVSFKSNENITTLKFPAWRPGRYQLADFAKNVNHFQVFSKDGKSLVYKKVDKNTWEVENGSSVEFTVKYSYYANEMNAGSSFLDESQLYVNPVNCFLFNPDEYDQEIKVTLDIPDNWEMANPLETKNKTFKAKSFDELADSPFICSAELQQASYEVNGITFNLWFNGIVKPDWDRVISDFKKFTEKQLEMFIEFPVDVYHFLFQILPYKTYHGVEHEKCTVITIGPSYSVFKDYYTEFLGVSSHELYHTWNVKSIRPSDMMPYDFTKENFSELGYIAEGVTTYMGDLMLYKSGVFGLKQYMKEMNAQLQRHFDNFGRFNYSVAESSWDTWLDGYEIGAPGRKVSIYTEGCLLAFILDVFILRATKNKKNLDNVMRGLYFDFGKKGRGVTEKDYQATIENVSGTSFQWFFDDYVHGTKGYNALLVDCFEYIGFELKHEPVSDAAAAYLGAKTIVKGNQTVIHALYPGGAMDMGGAMVGDEILGINGVVVNQDFPNWVDYFMEDEKTITLKRNGQIKTFIVPQTNRPYYQRYHIEVVENPDKNQLNGFDGWRSAPLGDRGQSTIILD